jgi:hypothetical protein
VSNASLLQIQIGQGQGTDAEELEDATGRLREELLELDVDAVDRPAAGPAPPGSRGLEIAALGTLLVTLAHDALPVVLATLGRWVSRHGERSVTIELDGDRIEVSGASAEDQRRLVDAFLARHSGGGQWKADTH